MRLLFTFLFSLFIHLSLNFIYFYFGYGFRCPNHQMQSNLHYQIIFGKLDLFVEFYEYHFIGILSLYHHYHFDSKNHQSCYHLTLNKIRITAFFSIFLLVINLFIYFILIVLLPERFFLCNFLFSN